MTASILSALDTDGFKRLSAQETRALAYGFAPNEAQERAFVQSWNDLEPDTYMADGGKYRLRRFGVCELSGEGIRFLEHQPHYQSVRFNHLNGGTERWFAPLTEDFKENPYLLGALNFLNGLLDGTTDKGYRAEIHQFRICATPREIGKPSPEGLHRDGVDYVFIMFVDRKNVQGGETVVTDASGEKALARFTLSTLFESAILNDAITRHGVSPVTLIEGRDTGRRDVLVVTLRKI